MEPANVVCPKCGNGNYMRHLVGKGVGRLNMKCINCNSYFNSDELYKAIRNPEPLYPSWQEWFDTFDRKIDVDDPIPADIAEKLGLEPKEE